MPIARRPFALLAVAAALVSAAGCGSNKDKLVGKWKVESTPKGDATMGGKLYMFMEFNKDGTCKIGLELNDPAAKKEAGTGDLSVAGKYTVTGDKLELKPADNAKDKGNPMGRDDAFTMKFDGNDKLTLTNKEGDAKLSRVK